jgi:hypothetical protein
MEGDYLVRHRFEVERVSGFDAEHFRVQVSPVLPLLPRTVGGHIYGVAVDIF